MHLYQAGAATFIWPSQWEFSYNNFSSLFNGHQMFDILSLAQYAERKYTPSEVKKVRTDHGPIMQRFNHNAMLSDHKVYAIVYNIFL